MTDRVTSNNNKLVGTHKIFWLEVSPSFPPLLRFQAAVNDVHKRKRRKLNPDLAWRIVFNQNLHGRHGSVCDYVTHEAFLDATVLQPFHSKDFDLGFLCGISFTLITDRSD
jgi:hypothetical protein